MDFVCIERHLIIEVDGKYHALSEQIEQDLKREQALQQLGFQIVRFTNEEVLCNSDNTICKIKKLVNNP